MLDAKTAAALVKLTPERIRQLAKEGWIEKVGRGKYPLVSVVQGYIAFLKDAERRSSKSAAATRMQDIKTERAEFEFAVAKREFLPREDMFAAVDLISATVKNEMLGLPARATRDAALREKLDDEITNALNRIADKIERATKVAAEGGDVFEDAEAAKS